MDPAELQSVKTFISEQEMEKESSQKQVLNAIIIFLATLLKSSSSFDSHFKVTDIRSLSLLPNMYHASGFWTGLTD